MNVTMTQIDRKRREFLRKHEGVTYQAVTLRGDYVHGAIKIRQHRIPFDPKYGRKTARSIASSTIENGAVGLAKVTIENYRIKYSPGMFGEIVLSPTVGTADRELVLVECYRTGRGSQMPGFNVILWEEEAQELDRAASIFRAGAGEEWLLVAAPLGWAENIAGQFINRRGFDNQVLEYKPWLSDRAG